MCFIVFSESQRPVIKEWIRSEVSSMRVFQDRALSVHSVKR